MSPTKAGPLAVLFVVVTLVSWLLVRLVYTDLPVIPWTAIPMVLLLALGEVYTAWMTKARIARKPDTKPVEPLAVARLAALAKASAYVGAVFAGFFAGFALHTLSLLRAETPRSDFFVATGSSLSFIALVVAALFLEHACRVPKDSDRDGS
ncbi:DUF3180 domain-containing protein [Nonomuraea longicatena]|uniref:DUF3180 domain-containing protein n=1 Tax=Nonomuraea longicatena TaxID=83682 RepID=A0ABP4BDU5_9ACTN